MQFNVEEKGDTVILRMSGEVIGGPAAAKLSEQLRAYIDKGRKQFLVDMNEVAWMNSSGLGILIGSLTTVRNHGGDLKLVFLPKKVKELLRITKLECVFDVHDDEDKAIASFT